MGQFVKVGTKADFEDLEGESLSKRANRASPFSISLALATQLRTPVRIAAARWPKG